MAIGDNIRATRKLQGLTQKELAARLGISPAVIAQWENGIRNPKHESIKRIADALNVCWTDLCDDVDEHTKAVATIEYTTNVLQCERAVKKALKNISQQQPSEEVAEDLAKIRIALERMNEEGRKEAVKRVWELEELSKYKYKEV